MDKNTDPLRWGIIGFGKFSDAAMAPAIWGTKGHILCGIQGRDEGRIRSFADKYGTKFCTTRPEELLARSDIDAIYIAAPNSLHAQFAIMAADRKLHVLCEKPMARSVVEAASMVDACRKKDVRLMIGNMMRFNPCHKWALDFIRSGNLGDITAARGRFGFDLPSTYPLSTSPWHLDAEMAGGGSLMSVGIHVVDLLRYLIGREVKSVSALMESREYALPMDWTSATLLRFEGGAIAEIRSSFDNRFEENDMELFGTKGIMKLSGTLWRESTGVVEVIGDFGRCRYEPGQGFPNPYVLQIEHFADCIRKGSETLVNGVEGKSDLEICQAAYESARTGKTVVL